MANTTLSSTNPSRLHKPSGAVGWLTFGLATAGAVAGAGLIMVTLHLVTSRSDKLPSVVNSAELSTPREQSADSTAKVVAEGAELDVSLGSAALAADEPPEAVVMVGWAPDPAEAAATRSPETISETPVTNSAVTATAPVVTAAVARGDYMTSLGDYAAARLLYRFAADRGSADAALKLARTYDAPFSTSSSGLKPDAAEAARWYRAANDFRSAVQGEQ